MPPSLRRRGQAQPPSPVEHYLDPESEDEAEDAFDDQDDAELAEAMEPGEPGDDEALNPEDEEEVEEEEQEQEEDDEEADAAPSIPEQPVPENWKEISSLASWTVTTFKPGCGVEQLRSPNTSLFWQSDGPQPHLLNIHFFKLVRIVGLRLYLDFEADESYTPTRICFLAGSGPNDLIEWGEMRLEAPRGWVWADFAGVAESEDEEDASDMDVDEEASQLNGEQQRKRKKTLPVLRAHLVQIKIMENHQNGKDTHLRGVQIFAVDQEAPSLPAPSRSRVLTELGNGNGEKGGGARKPARKLPPMEWDRIPDIR